MLLNEMRPENSYKEVRDCSETANNFAHIR